MGRSLKTWCHLIHCAAAALMLLCAGLPSAAQETDTGTGLPLIMAALDYGDYTRLSFNLDDAPDYQISYSATQVSIVFEGRYSLDASQLIAATVTAVGRPSSSRIGNRTIINFLIPEGATIQDFRSGPFVVIDVFSDGRSVERERDQIIQFPGIDIPRGLFAVDMTSAPTVSDQPSEATTRPAEPNTSEDSPEVPSPVSNVIDFRISGDGNDNRDISIRPTALSIPSGLSFSFDLPRETEAAVFQRGNHLWVIFDEPYGFDGSALEAQAALIGRRVSRLAVIPHPDALVFRMSLRNTQFSIVEKQDLVWTINLKDTPTSPRFPLSPVRRLEANAGQQVFIPANNIGRKLSIEDPDIGDELIVLPLLREGEGLADRFNFSSAELLTTSQGMAVVPRLDGVRVERLRGGVAVAAPGVEILTDAPDDSGYAQGDLRLVDFKRWRLGNDWEYRKYKSLAQYQMSVADPDKIQDARWRMARFYLGHRRGAEALGIMNLMLLDEPRVEEKPDFKAAHGIANYYLGRYSEALADFNIPELASEQDAELWKSVISEKLGRYADALDHYRRGKDILGTYDPKERADFQLAAIRAAIEEENPRMARDELRLLAGEPLTPGQSIEAVFLGARLSDLQNDGDLALAQYEDLADSRNREVSARARFAAIAYKLEKGTLSTLEAIQAFERLRYAWRGAQFEMRVLLELASLYLKENNFEKGLDTYKLASETHPQMARDLRVGNRMAEIFREIFLGSYATSLSPIKGITIFWKYQELTPPGAEGDTMIRRLADRLVDLDLLSEAADLYDYQVRERLEGVPRAQIAVRLAMIHLLNDDAEKAIEIMRATREPRLPDDIALDRRAVEARALSELKRYEEAEVLISSDTTYEADLLRADIHWASRDYGAAVTALQKVLRSVDSNSYVIEERDRFNIMRLALSMTFLEDRRGLEALRARFERGMGAGEFANSFDLLTREAPLTGREIRVIAGQIADIEKLQSYMQSYRSDFLGR